MTPIQRRLLPGCAMCLALLACSSRPDTPKGVPKGAPEAAFDSVLAAAAERLFMLGFSLSQQGRLDEAIARTGEALRLNPRHPNANYNMSVFLSQRGRVPEAMRYVEASLQDNPGNINALYNLGFFLQTQGRAGEAMRRYREVLRLDPAHTMSHYYLGMLLTRQGKRAEAVPHCVKAAADNPGLLNPECARTP